MIKLIVAILVFGSLAQAAKNPCDKFDEYGFSSRQECLDYAARLLQNQRDAQQGAGNPAAVPGASASSSSTGQPAAQEPESDEPTIHIPGSVTDPCLDWQSLGFSSEIQCRQFGKAVTDSAINIVEEIITSDLGYRFSAEGSFGNRRTDEQLDSSKYIQLELKGVMFGKGLLDHELHGDCAIETKTSKNYNYTKDQYDNVEVAAPFYWNAGVVTLDMELSNIQAGATIDYNLLKRIEAAAWQWNFHSGDPQKSIWQFSGNMGTFRLEHPTADTVVNGFGLADAKIMFTHQFSGKVRLQMSVMGSMDYLRSRVKNDSPLIALNPELDPAKYKKRSPDWNWRPQLALSFWNALTIRGSHDDIRTASFDEDSSSGPFREGHFTRNKFSAEFDVGSIIKPLGHNKISLFAGYQQNAHTISIRLPEKDPTKVFSQKETSKVVGVRINFGHQVKKHTKTTQTAGAAKR